MFVVRKCSDAAFQHGVIFSLKKRNGVIFGLWKYLTENGIMKIRNVSLLNLIL